MSWVVCTWSWVVVVLLCIGIGEGVGGESLKLQNQELCKDAHHKPGTFSYTSSVIQSSSKRSHVMVYF